MTDMIEPASALNMQPIQTKTMGNVNLAMGRDASGETNYVE